MSDATSESLTVPVRLPREALRHHPWSPDDIAAEMRALWLVEQVRERRLGYGKAAELAGMPVAAFLALMGRHHVTPLGFEVGEVDREVDGHGIAVGVETAR
ncbi:UPF0175 family protein [Myxococcota bacterium]|nr:UPF0175 family protein [Myxococcota bacterium]